MRSQFNPDWLWQWNLYTPKKIALKDRASGRDFTYAQFYQIANSMAGELKKKGVRRGHRVAVLAQNRVETIFLFFALQRLGAMLVPINYRLTTPEVDYVLSDSDPILLFFENEFSDIIEGLQNKTQALDILTLNQWMTSPGLELPFEGGFDEGAMILYTSGTTGFPKGVVITPQILFWNSINTTMSLNLTSEDVTVNFSPFFHTGGWNVLLTPFIHRGATTVLLSKFDADQVLDVIEEEKVTLFFGVPTTLSMMARSEGFDSRNLQTVRFAIVGGEPMPLNMIQLWHRKGVAIRQGFGMTECGPNCFSLSEKDAEKKIGSIGRPNFYVQTRIVNEANEDVAADDVGELLLSGPMCMTEYWQNKEATTNSFHQGWLRTGDLVKRDSEDYYYVVGRIKDMYISGGENVYPAEIEKVMSTHPDIDEVAVLGVKDPQWGEVGKAFIVPKKTGSLSLENIQTFCGEHLARYKIPKKFEFLSELPKGSSGKILKKELGQ